MNSLSTQPYTPAEARAIREKLEAIAQGHPWVDAKGSGGFFGRDVKNALVLPDHSKTVELKTSIVKRLHETPAFQLFTRPDAFSLTFAKYKTGHYYGPHVDSASQNGNRADLAFTLFLSEPDSYDGGNLVLEENEIVESIRLAAGQVFVYDAGAVHHVEPVAWGERVVCIGWIKSHIRGAERRQVLFDLDCAISELIEAHGKSEGIDRLVKIGNNLTRMWMD